MANRDLSPKFFSDMDLIQCYTSLYLGSQGRLSFSEAHKLHPRFDKIYVHLRKRFDNQKIAQIAQEKCLIASLSYAISAGEILSPQTIRQYKGFTPITEPSFEISSQHKEIIRLDAHAFIDCDIIGELKPKFSPEYKSVRKKRNILQKVKSGEKSIALEAYQNLNRILTLQNPEDLRDALANQSILRNKSETIRKKEIEKIKANKQFLIKDYDLEKLSPAWAKYFAPNERFRNIQNQMIAKGFMERNIGPDILPYMNIYDFQDIMYHTFCKPGKQHASIFESPIQQRLKTILSYKENEEIFTDWMYSEGYKPKFINERLYEMKKHGTCGGIIHGHHREAVSNAGKYPNFHQVNDPENIVFVSPIVHDFIHHQDFLNKNTQTFSKINVDQADFIFSITDIFKTGFHKNPCQNNDFDLNQSQNHIAEQTNDIRMQRFFNLESRQNT